MQRNIIWESFHFDFQTKEGEEEETYNDDPAEMMMQNAPSLMDTPFGVYNMDDTMNPFKNFNFWMAHTNFQITPEVFDIIDTTLGVETLTVLTPLRFIVSFGKAFKPSEVKARIEHDLCGKHIVSIMLNDIMDEQTKQESRKIYKSLKKNPYWLMCILPNGNIEYDSYKKKEDFNEKLEVYKEVKFLSDGMLISSNDDK